MRRVYASAECKRTGDEPRYSDSDWARVAGVGWEADGSRGMDGPCRSRWPNQEESEPIMIRDSAPCPSRDGGGGPPGPRDVGPPLCPTQTESPGATAGPLRCGRARGQIAVAPGGDSRSAPDADDCHAPSPSHGTQGSRRAGGNVWVWGQSVRPGLVNQSSHCPVPIQSV